MVLERDGLRIVHAYWDQRSVDAVRGKSDAVEVFQQHALRIQAYCDKEGMDKIDTALCHQNENPVKLLTSGPERRIDVPFEASGKMRFEERVKCWRDYDDPGNNLTVFGHYSLKQDEPRTGPAVCCDYGVAKRTRNESNPVSMVRAYQFRLGAIRMPERVIFFDDGTCEDLQ